MNEVKEVESSLEVGEASEVVTEETTNDQEIMQEKENVETNWQQRPSFFRIH